MRLLHASLIISDLTVATHFYEGILGLKRDKRPHLDFEGIFYQLGDAGQQLHLMQVNDPYHDCIRPQHGGRDRHLAFAVNKLQVFVDKLEAAGIAFTRSRSGRAALFCRDPDDNVIELCEV
ncbi:MAG: VOC family protein [Mariprofundaceae bacterium]|nr:VOC family protein [Mariprofundaceae bacterium]